MLASCLDVASGLAVCQDTGRCPETLASGGGAPTGGGTAGGAPDFIVSATVSTAAVDVPSPPAEGVSSAQLW